MDAKFYGNKATKRLHWRNKPGDRCRAHQVKPSNLVQFATAQEALNKGYRGCRFCFPRDAR
jgi:methylphosphotriester-DNA--protein-cysteine methyltransferase